MKTPEQINEKIRELFAEAQALNEAKELSPKTELKIELANDAINRLNQIHALQWVMIEGVEL